MALRYTPINDPQAGSGPGQGTIAEGISNNGEIVGSYGDGSSVVHAFDDVGGVFVDLPLAFGVTADPRGVNDLGQIVGSYKVAGKEHGFFYSGGTYLSIDDPNAAAGGATNAFAINDLSQVVGRYTDSGGKTHGFLDVAGSFTTIDVPASTFTEARGINAAGVIVGNYHDSGGAVHGFIDINGSFTSLDDPLATSGTLALGINDHNQVVGQYTTGGVIHGFLWSNGIFTTIDDPIPALFGSIASGITNSGQILGFAQNLSGVVSAFLTSPLHVAPNDYSGDNRSDTLWRQSSGALAVWQMNRATISSGATVTYLGAPLAPDASWSVVGIGDFSFDGSADVLWRQSGGLALWQMNGSSVTSSSAVTFNGSAVAPDASWSVAATSDFSGDGMTDVLWRQTTGGLALWQMNGATISQSNGVTYLGSTLAPDASWSIAGTGDFSGDGKADILWRQASSSSVALWQMNGATVTSSGPVTYQGNTVSPDPTWSVAAIGDFDGDGRADVLWRQASSGTLVEWLMAGNNILSIGVPTFHGSLITPDSSWSIVEIGDFNNDGSTDLLWRQSGTGTLAQWLMNGSTIAAISALPATPDSSWQVQSKPTSFV